MKGIFTTPHPMRTYLTDADLSQRMRFNFYEIELVIDFDKTLKLIKHFTKV